MTHPSEASTFEHLAFNAWPALRVVVQGNWLLRFADGYTKRANSVNALGLERDTPVAELERRVEAAEAHYRRQGIASTFKLSPLMDPGLDAVLAARGYSHLDETLMMVADLTRGPGAVAMPAGVAVDLVRNEPWSRTYSGFNNVPAARQSIHDRMLDSLVPVGGFALATEDGEPAAAGLGVLEGEHVGLFDIVADPARRRAGHGRRVVEGIMAWGRAQGATRAYLMVVAANAPAIALYERLGYREAYRSHYRIPPARQS
ncbi:MAG: GNAT family N-acetyltransferase [Alphaproteobacteria bacterium]|nr:GNAT family N-acetyltransferase [Alphaproteobacteria bacterium]MCW5743358.1 GNAT family N-acetyltransferase [Alphaproteobacteria bacterium]